MDEAGCHHMRRLPRAGFHRLVQQHWAGIGHVRLAIIMFEAITREAFDEAAIAFEGGALERSDADMAMAQPHQYGGAGRRGLVAPVKLLAGFDQ